jgi:hypothetical protein
MGIEALGYRPYRGPVRGPTLRFWPIGRIAMGLVFRRKVFWIFLIIALLSFVFFSAVIYLQAQVEGKLGQRVPDRVREGFFFTGKGEAYQQFISQQGTVVMVMLALAGRLLVGDDFRSKAIPFYLSRPITKLDYFLGKLAAVAGLAALITLLPALVLFLEYGAFTESFDYYRENLRLLGAITAYGALVSLVPAILLLGLASLLKRTVPLIIAWGGLFIFLPAVVAAIRSQDPGGRAAAWSWGLLDLWSDLRWVSNGLFGIREEVYSERWPYAAAVLTGSCLLALVTFWRRIAAVEVVK